MRDYGMDPRHIGEYTMAELQAVLEHQNAEWQAIRERNAEIARRSRR